jgi:hypothetical protein
MKFVAYTDHKNLVNLFSLRGQKIHQRLERWAIQLSEYAFEVRYVPGRQNIVADYLSRDGAFTDAEIQSMESTESETLVLQLHSAGVSVHAYKQTNHSSRSEEKNNAEDPKMQGGTLYYPPTLLEVDPLH